MSTGDQLEAAKGEVVRSGMSDGSTWSTWGKADGVPELLFRSIEESVVASPDDSVWGIPVDHDGEGELGCAGIVNFDGSSWTPYLEDRCVHAYDVAPDGAVWLLAGDASDPAVDPVSTYVIQPALASDE